MKVEVNGEVVMSPMKKRPGYFRLRKKLVVDIYCPGLLHNNYVVSIPRGFETDLASIPLVLRPFFDRLGRNVTPAVIHDYLYKVKWGTREKCDGVFKALLRLYGVSSWRTYLLYTGVRLGGWTRGSW